MDNLLLPILAGWVFGYLVNYLADVLPTSRRLSGPKCRRCGTQYRLREYVLLLACTTCGQRRGLRTWIVLAAMTALGGYIWFEPPDKLGYFLSMAVLTYLAVVTVIDAEHRLILHPTSVVGAVLGLGAGWISHGRNPTLLGGAAGLVIMLVLYLLGLLFSWFRARRMRAAGMQTDQEEALGAGDVILATVLGLLLGWPLIGFGLLLGVLLGGLFGAGIMVSMLVTRRYGKQALLVFMPYGPFLIASAFAIVFFPGWVAGLLPA